MSQPEVYTSALVDIKSYQKGEEIGSGAFGKVYKCIKENQSCAVKVINSGDYHQVESEIHGIGIHHPTLIKFIGYSPVDFDGKNNYAVFMELAEKGSLEKVFKLQEKSMKPDDFNPTVLLLAFITIARGMMILHQNNIIHRDLSDRNIVFSKDYIAKITDFGLVKLNASLLESNEQNRRYGSIEFLAPEILNGNPYSKAADVYSFGVLMRKAITLFPDFNFTNYQIFSDLIEACLDYNPDIRPSFEGIYNQLKNFVNNDNFFQDEFDIDRIEDCIREIDVDETFYVLKSEKSSFSYTFNGIGSLVTTGIAAAAYQIGTQVAKKAAEEAAKQAAEEAAKQAAKKAAEEAAKMAAESLGGVAATFIVPSVYGTYKIGKKY